MELIINDINHTKRYFKCCIVAIGFNSVLVAVIGALVGIVSIILFFIFNSFSGNMVIFDLPTLYAVVIPLLNPVPFKNQNDTLVESLLKEKGYIFAKCMDALRRWLGNKKQFTAHEDFLHYAVPISSTPVVSIQIVQERLVKHFIGSSCLLSNTSWSSTRDLYTAFQCYCLNVNEIPCDKASFGRYLAQTQGVSSKKQSDVRGFAGIAIKGGDSGE